MNERAEKPSELPTHSKEEPVVITDPWIRDEVKRRRAILKTNPKAKFKPHQICSKEKGFMIWIAKDLTVTLALRMRVKVKGGKSKRTHTVLGHWVDPKEIKSDAAMTVAKAKVKATITRAGFEQHGFAVETEMPTLRQAIERYVIARRDLKDPRTSKRRAPLPESWEENITRFTSMFKEYIDGPTSVLTYDNMLETRSHYVLKEYGEVTDETLQKVRAIFTTTMPMLKWFRDAKGYMPYAGMIESLTPEGYKANERFLYPGEWQASIAPIDKYVDYTGLFLRYLFTTGVRSETALGMKWSEVDLSNPGSFKDKDGKEHECVVWIVPRSEKGRMKGRNKKGGDNLERRILVTGTSLKILRELRSIFEARHDADPEYRGVWPKEMLKRWRHRQSATQRAIEKAAGTKRWNRYTLRKTHTTYLEYLHCPADLRSVSLTHTAPPVGAAAVTQEHYSFADAARTLQGEDDPLYRLGPWLLKLHALIHDIEIGHLSPELKRMQQTLRVGGKSSDMRDRYHIDTKWIGIEEHSEPPKLRVVGK
jgi:integrase